MSYAFRIVNVFAESPLAGNPLCVFENGEGSERRDDAGARAAVQPVRDDVRAAADRRRHGARAHLHADVRDGIRRPSDARHGARRARPARDRRPRARSR